MSRWLGITVMPEFVQCEGIGPVLDRLEAAGACAVATSPYVMAPVADGAGAREPPIDAGAGEVRLLDRPLWGGRRELWVETAPSFVPTAELYRGLRYQPAPATSLTRERGAVVGEFLDAAKRRGLQVYLQVQAAIPPGYRVQFGGPVEDDLPRMPDGRTPAERVDRNASLASPHVRDYQRALLTDLWRHYPQLDGIRCDWPEYPPYLLDCVFLDFGPHVESAAARLGVDFERARADSGRLYQRLHGELTYEDLEAWGSADGAAQWLLDYPGVADALRLKALLSRELLTGFRQALDDCGAGTVRLAPSAFPPPWSLVSGMDLRGAASCCQEVSVKLYGMHWAMMLWFYGRQLLAANQGLDERALTHGLARLLDIADDEGLETLDAYTYPGPDEPHPVGRGAQLRKLAAARRRAGAMPVHALAHGYGPVDDFLSRAATALEGAPDGIWVNRYGYLSDAKLDGLGRLVR